MPKDQPVWRTREGVELEPRSMTATHPLATIHMIERKRLENIIQLAYGHDDIGDEAASYYTAWPDAYEALVDEAVRRKLVERGSSPRKLRS